MDCLWGRLSYVLTQCLYPQLIVSLPAERQGSSGARLDSS